jgi:hypothetical protein
MSTFYGGDQLALVTSLSRSSIGQSTYTVPAGHWAEVSFITVNTGGSFPGISTGSVNGQTITPTGSVGNFVTQFGMVSSGGVISIETGGIGLAAYCYAGIKVYKNP